MIPDLMAVISRDLDALRRELDLYPDDASVWSTVKGQPNSAGTLVLHLIGNLRHFIGTTLGTTGFVRNRDAEFSTRDVPRAELLSLIDTTRGEVMTTLRGLSPLSAGETFPLQMNGMSLRTTGMLLHLATHLSYHLGQVDYHRRALTGDATGANAMSLQPLAIGAPAP